MTCQHLHGDHIAPLGLWVCGQCYAKLESRPKRYGIVPAVPPYTGAAQQQIVWQAEVIRSAQRTTLSQFITAMVRWMQHKTPGLSLADATTLAIDELAAMGVEFGDPSYDWSRMSAVDWAREAMTYWEQEGGNE